MKHFNKLKSSILNMDSCISQIHFIGIGGSGMGGIAKIMLAAGYGVSGSDLVSNRIITKLISLGVNVFFDHKCENVYGADMIVVSSAIRSDNPEIIAAINENILIVHRSEMLEMLMRSKLSIAVAGTHGKSTTTAMIVSIFFESGLNPTFVNGAVVKSLGTCAHFGDGKYIVVEADESDASFLYLNPVFEVITNIEEDHMDTYQGNFENLKKSFINFLNNLSDCGRAVVCLDDVVIRSLLPQIRRKIITYGFSEDADLCIIDYSQTVNKNSFILRRKKMVDLHLTMNIPGRHNALNASAAIAVATECCGIGDDIILKSMSQFNGISRRFENLGTYNLKYLNGRFGEFILVSDFGHHPVELNVTIETIRVGWPDKRLVMVFQPHRFTRIRDLYDDFVKVLSKVDILLMLDVYSAGERFIPGADSVSLCSTIRRCGTINPTLVSEKVVCDVLSLILRNNDFLLMQGAGTIGEIAHKFIISRLLVS